MKILLVVLAAFLGAVPAAEARDRTAPHVSLTAPVSGSTVSGSVTVMASASDNVAVDHVTFTIDETAVTSDYSAPYTYAWDTTNTTDGQHRITARAQDRAGNLSASPDPSVTVTVQNGALSPPPAGGFHYTTQPAHTGEAHDSAYCAANHNAIPEVHADNDPANHTRGDPAAAQWDPNPYWKAWNAKRAQVDGQATGTTGELIQWAGCKWGIDEDMLRAVAVQETDWHQYSVGDNCGVEGEASYSIIQVKNRYCNGGIAWGGYPQTQQSTAFALDFYGAQLRSCYDGDFYDGGSWLYHGQTVDQIGATKGWDYVMWGCVGSWFSGGWYDSGAQSYIDSVKRNLANRAWAAY